MPGSIVYGLPLLAGHLRVRGSDVFRVIAVYISVHRGTVRIQYLMISRSRQRGENEELKEIDRQLLLDYPDIALDARRRVAWESEDVSGKREDFCLAPRLKHRAVLSDLVLPFGRTFQAFRIDA